MQRLIELIQEKNIEAAKARYEMSFAQMTERDRLFFDALLNQLSGNYLESETKYLEILNKYNKDVGSIVNLVAIYNELNNFDKSIKIIEKYDSILNSDEFNLAKFDAYFGKGQLDKAEKIISSIKSNLTGRSVFKERKAAIFINKNQPEKAIKILEELISLGEGNKSTILSNLSAAYNKVGDHQKSFDCAKLANQINKDSWQSKLNMASSLLSLEKYSESQEILDNLIIEGHRNQEIIINLARIANIMGDVDKSILLCNEGLQVNPQELSLLTCLADNYSILREHEKSFQEFEKVLKLDIENELANWHYSLALLRNQNYKKGWEQYKWGFKRKTGGRGEYKFNPQNEWTKQSKTDKLVVWGEQGIGDQLMFAKFIKYIPGDTAAIEFQVESRLVSLLNDRLITRDGVTVIAYDSNVNGSHIPVGNLPAELWNDYSADSQSKKPFLRRKNPPQNSGPLRVGITWRGGKTERMQSKRSVPLGLFPRLKSLSTQDVKVIQLQYNPIDTEIAYLQKNFGNKLSLPRYDAIKDLDSWVDHIDSCDLLISVDNSAVHFAGAMGIPTLVMIPSHPDFRWGLNGRSNPWYEGVELLRDFAALSLDDLASAIDNWVFEQTIKIRGK